MERGAFACLCPAELLTEFALVSFLSRSSGFGEGDVSVTRGDVMWCAIAAGAGALVTASAGSLH